MILCKKQIIKIGQDDEMKKWQLVHFVNTYKKGYI